MPDGFAVGRNNLFGGTPSHHPNLPNSGAKVHEEFYTSRKLFPAARDS